MLKEPHLYEAMLYPSHPFPAENLCQRDVWHLHLNSTSYSISPSLRSVLCKQNSYQNPDISNYPLVNLSGIQDLKMLFFHFQTTFKDSGRWHRRFAMGLPSIAFLYRKVLSPKSIHEHHHSWEFSHFLPSGKKKINLISALQSVRLDDSTWQGCNQQITNLKIITCSLQFLPALLLQ